MDSTLFVIVLILVIIIALVLAVYFRKGVASYVLGGNDEKFNAQKQKDAQLASDVSGALYQLEKDIEKLQMDVLSITNNADGPSDSQRRANADLDRAKEATRKLISLCLGHTNINATTEFKIVRRILNEFFCTIPDTGIDEGYFHLFKSEDSKLFKDANHFMHEILTPENIYKVALHACESELGMCQRSNLREPIPPTKLVEVVKNKNV